MRKFKYLMASFLLFIMLLSVFSLGAFATGNDFTVTVKSENEASSIEAVYAYDKTYALTAEFDYAFLTDGAFAKYSWYKNGVLVDGADQATLVLGQVGDSGSYCCKVDIVDGAENLSAVSEPFAVNISPRELDVSSVKWNYTEPFVYDGKTHSVKLSGLPIGITVTYTTYDSQYEPTVSNLINADKYITHAEISYDTANCKLVGGAIPRTVSWEIKKATYDMSGITFADKTVTEDGYLKTLHISGNLPSGVSVAYYYNSKVFDGARYVGQYEIKAVFTGDFKNYEPIADMTAKLTVSPISNENPESESFSMVYRDSNGIKTVIVTPESAMPSGTYINAENVTAEYKNFDYSSFAGLGESASLVVLYDVTVCRSGLTVGTSGKFKVKILIPEEYRNAQALSAVYINDQKPEVINSVIEGDMLVFETDHFSLYGIVAVEAKTTPVFVAYVFVGMLVLLMFVIAFRRKPIFTTEAENESSEPKKDENTSFFKSQLLSEESPIDAVDITPDGSAESESTASLGNGKSNQALFVGVTERYRTSFTSRLIQSPDTIKGFYTELKNYILSFKGIKARTSWNYETYRKGRVAVVKVNIKGKSLIVNLALTPESYQGSKYRFSDLSDDKRYAELPMQLKIRSKRALSYAFELIDELMNRFGAEKTEIPEVDYRLPYESSEELASRGLIKIVTVKSKSKQVKSDIDEPDIDECDTVSVADSNGSRAVAENASVPESIELCLPSSKSRQGKLCSVSLGEIAEAFEANEAVTLEELKARGVVGKRYGKIKVLADGTLDKPLFIEADKFSDSAIKKILLAGGSLKQLD